MSGLIFVWIMLAGGPFAAAQSTDALRAYEVGDYRYALELAIEDGSADSLAFGARVLLAEGIGAEPVEMTRARLAEAGRLAERALALDPENNEARLQQAIVLSLRARAMGARPAYRARLGGRARALGEAVVEDAPGNAYAHGFLAIWHVEVIRRGGRLGVLVLGASMDEAQGHYAAAAELAPRDASLHWQWARALSATDPAKYAGEIEAALKRVEAAMPADELSRVLKARAQRFDEARAGMSADEIRKLAVALL